MLLSGVEKELGAVGRLDQSLRGIEVLGEEQVAILAVYLHWDVVGPRVTELRDWEAPAHQQGSPGQEVQTGGRARHAGPDRLSAGKAVTAMSDRATVQRLRSERLGDSGSFGDRK